MASQLSAVEKFLIHFHDRRPGLTANVFGDLPIRCSGRDFNSSYDILADSVPMDEANLKVLDLACGDGFLLSKLVARQQRGLALNGMDMSQGELAHAQLRLKGSAALYCGRAQAMPLESRSFDYLLCHMAIMLMDDAEQVLREIARVLKPGGVFAAVVGAASLPSIALTTYIEILSKQLRMTHLQDLRFGDRRFRDSEATATLLSADFKDIEITEIEIEQRLTPAELWNDFLDMYDLYLLSESARQEVKLQYLAAITPQVDPDGKLDYPSRLRSWRAAVQPR
jgi:ubiquinone/menaquinone biosynthesis C-methylase UbiE